ncbi:MAG: serine hydrolase domain-containing protein [Rhizomicrobium sp.]
MLFGEGRDDVAHYAAQRPLAHPPGTFWSYSSGNRESGGARRFDRHGQVGADFEAYMRERLFGPLGMASPVPKFDAAGTFIGSSYCFAAARDFRALRPPLSARRRPGTAPACLPQGWVDYAPHAHLQQSTDTGRYGAHWWLDIAGPGSFSANGFQGQFIVVVPDRDLVIVRLGATQEDTIESVKQWIRDIAECFPRLG